MRDFGEDSNNDSSVEVMSCPPPPFTMSSSRWWKTRGHQHPLDTILSAHLISLVSLNLERSGYADKILDDLARRDAPTLSVDMSNWNGIAKMLWVVKHATVRAMIGSKKGANEANAPSAMKVKTNPSSSSNPFVVAEVFPIQVAQARCSLTLTTIIEASIESSRNHYQSWRRIEKEKPYDKETTFFEALSKNVEERCIGERSAHASMEYMAKKATVKEFPCNAAIGTWENVSDQVQLAYPCIDRSWMVINAYVDNGILIQKDDDEATIQLPFSGYMH
ncbi:hypothetical protein TanjilG_14644 [Lupinus angustifolius]|uniref:Uncharacterized protein n=1 Tax=Lupinus angustifolius TaxID=3871 RepID=A0A1J7HGA4_LUPAN|nr:hypothetical protein TanjilG_14644 [Lupinus angustifolius]